MDNALPRLNTSGIHPIFEGILAVHAAFPCRIGSPATESPEELNAEEAVDDDPMDGPLGYDSDADAEERAAMTAERESEEGEDW